PRPWSNIIANPRFGLAVSQTGSGFSWIDNSQLAVLTRWQQEFTHDAYGKFLYVRDADSGETWSLSPAPMFVEYDHFECRHGLGYTTFVTEFAGIAAEWTLFANAAKPIEHWQVVFRNVSGRPRRLELTSYLEWNCGVAPSPRREFHKLFIDTRFDRARNAIFARGRMWDVPTKNHGHWNADFPYFPAIGTSERVTDAQGDKTEFFGRYNDTRTPDALEQVNWDPQFGAHEDAVAALRSKIALAADQERVACFALAVGKSVQETEKLLEGATDAANVAKALDAARAQWTNLLSAHRVETETPSINYLANDWLRYQAISARIWGRAGYYQQSGAYGFRDQLQDSQVWLTIAPERCRAQINLHAKHQFADGSVYHWWHPLSEQGLITTMTDDLLWLGFVTANFIRETNDYSVLEDTAAFLDDETATPIHDHVQRAFERVFKRTSQRGLPFIGTGDWNDGLSAAGTQERGESIWLGHFLAGLLADWIAIYERIADGDSAFRAQNGGTYALTPELAKTRVAAFKEKHKALVNALNTEGWDGDWYYRATLDDGSKIGSKENEVGKIFLNAQTWAILNDVADESRKQQCWNAVKKHLVREVGALLLAPAYETPNPNIGYITRYAAGLRENGGVYTHAATWAISAAAKMRDAETVGALLRAIDPSNKDPERYWAEPYVLPGNVDGPESPRYGRGGWTWYTGSAQWLHRVICEWVIGVRPQWNGLLIDPCLPPEWDNVKMTRPWRGCTYDIEITRTSAAKNNGASSGAMPQLKVDGKAIDGNLIPPPEKTGAMIAVQVTI
ncbi:MAG: glycosyl hydrolase family 65 protein, partial [Phycisphaerae bacterium]